MRVGGVGRNRHSLADLGVAGLAPRAAFDIGIVGAVGEERLEHGKVQAVAAAIGAVGAKDRMSGEGEIADGVEVPILDGSAAPFIDAIDPVGLVACNASRRFLKVLKPVRVAQGKAFAELTPDESGFRLDVEIDFGDTIIGRQRKIFALSGAAYRREISRARTFGFMRDVERLWKAGFALGASLDNTVAIGDDGVINPEGLRYRDEFVRHKTLDAIGDLALAGMPILAAYRSYCGGHRLNVAVLENLFSDRSNYAILDGGARRETGYAEIGNGIAVPAYAPDVH